MHLKKKILLLLGFFILVSLNLISIGKVYARHTRMAESYKIFNEIDQESQDFQQLGDSDTPLVLGAAVESDIKIGDARAANLKYFLRKYNSPLYEEADYIVSVSDKYGFDYRLLIAIAMQESGLCKAIPENSHNCWGYGIYGDHVMRFDSYSDGIDAVAKGIKEDYIDHGLITPETIMSKYTPSSNGSWANGVLWVLKQLQ